MDGSGRHDSAEEIAPGGGGEGPGGLPDGLLDGASVSMGAGGDGASMRHHGAGGGGGEGDDGSGRGGGEGGGGGGGGDGDDGVPAELPPHACTYCHIYNPRCVVKCVTTGRWFCNGRAGATASHIVQHLTRSRCKEVALHPESPLGDSVLECYNCGCRNVFILGFIPSKTESGVVVLLCREPCLTLGALRDEGWDLSMWQAIIEDRAFLPWLVSVPTSAEELKARPITTTQIAALELAWRTAPDATADDLLAKQAEEGDAAAPGVAPVLLQYEDGFQYQELLTPLIKMEADEAKLLSQSLRQEGISLRWDASSERGARVTAIFHHARVETEMRVMVGDELRLKLPSLAAQMGITSAAIARAEAKAAAAGGAGGGRGGESKVTSGGRKGGRGGRSGGATSAGAGGGRAAGGDDDDAGAWSAVGVVKDITDGQVTWQLTMVESDDGTVPLTITTGFTVELVWRSTSFDRMQAALRKFAVDERSVSAYLYHTLLGHAVEPAALPVTLPTDFNAPHLPALNHSQREAVTKVLQRPLSLIQGPPGTGKTVTSATIVYHLSRQGQGQVLVAAPSNVAVDHLTEKIAATGLRVVRVAARSREAVPSPVDHLCLHTMAATIGAASRPELKRLLALREERGLLGHADERKLVRLMREAEAEVLAAADVVCVTCASAGDGRLEGMRFKQVLIDEATQACEPECLIPIVNGAKQLVLVGDHQQLGPVVMSKLAAQAGLSQSLFERLIMLGVRPIRLTVQYRMHPALSEWPSNTFYEGALQNGVSLGERACPHDIPWPVASKPMYFVTCTGAEEISSSGTSFLNRGEAAAVEKVVTQFLKCGVDPHSIGVITPYEGQRAYTVAHMTQYGSCKSSAYTRIEVASVDSFQGREKDYIVLSCVRSNMHQGIGFLDDPRRLNVALTRAKFGLVVVGNPRVLAKQALWHMLLHHFLVNGVLMEGRVDALVPSAIHLPAPSRAYTPRTNAVLRQAMAAHMETDRLERELAAAGPVGSDSYEAVYPTLPAGKAAAAAAAADPTPPVPPAAPVELPSAAAPAAATGPTFTSPPVSSYTPLTFAAAAGGAGYMHGGAMGPQFAAYSPGIFATAMGMGLMGLGMPVGVPLAAAAAAATGSPMMPMGMGMGMGMGLGQMGMGLPAGGGGGGGGGGAGGAAAAGSAKAGKPKGRSARPGGGGVGMTEDAASVHTQTFSAFDAASGMGMPGGRGGGGGGESASAVGGDDVLSQSAMSAASVQGAFAALLAGGGFATG